MKIPAIVIFVLVSTNVFAKMPYGEIKTWREQAAMVAAPATPDQLFLETLENAIRDANSNSPSLTRPLTYTELRKLQLRLLVQGQPIEFSTLSATTDYAQALLRESPNSTLPEKVSRLPDQLRKPFHGNVAEFAEARDRGLVLTKSRTSELWDLTESKFQPRNYQMKIYGRSSNALKSILEDLDGKTGFTRHGILTRDTLERGVTKGQITRLNSDTYVPFGRTDVELHPSSVFNRPSDSSLYAKTGRDTLIGRGLVTEESGGMINASESVSRLEWVGRAGKYGGAALIVGTESYMVWQYTHGGMTQRQFVKTQTGFGAGLVAAIPGAEAGAAIGAAVVGGPEDPIAVVTVPAGAVIGGIITGVAGTKAADAVSDLVYQKLDDKQRMEVEQFVRSYYAVSNYDRLP